MTENIELFDENTLFSIYGIVAPLKDFSHPYIAYKNGKSLGGYERIQDIPKGADCLENFDYGLPSQSMALKLLDSKARFETSLFSITMTNIHYYYTVCRYLPKTFKFGFNRVPNNIRDIETEAYDIIMREFREMYDGANIEIQDNRDIRVNGKPLTGEVVDIKDGVITYAPRYKFTHKRVNSNATVYVDGVATNHIIAKSNGFLGLGFSR